MNCILIDPPYRAYLQDKLFDEKDTILNRDDVLRPFINIKEFFEKNGFAVHTVDFFFNNNNKYKSYYYFSFGIMENYQKLKMFDNVHLLGFIILEPPIIGNKIYKSLRNISNNFYKVFLLNIIGDGYDKSLVIKNNLKLFYHPHSFLDIHHEYWKNNKRDNIVLINGNKSKFFSKELYSKRIDALLSLNKFTKVDLYGTNWNKISRENVSWDFLRNFLKIQKIYKGTCSSKFKILKNYKFSICFENSQINGYVSEKIYDCFHVGTIPIYLGAPNIKDLIPSNCYIDFREYKNYRELFVDLKKFNNQKIEEYKNNAKDFLKSEKNKIFYYSFTNIISQTIGKYNE